MVTTYYEVLNVSREADVEQIQQAFRTLAMQHHPDKGGDAALFSKINEAYEVLSIEDRRAAYDQECFNEASEQVVEMQRNENDDDTVKIPESLIRRCALLLRLEKKIKLLRGQMKDINQQKKELHAEIMDGMKTLKLSTIETNDGSVHRQQFKRKEAINESFLNDALGSDRTSQLMKGRRVELKERIKVIRAQS